jgi:hypothetical protein
MNTINSRAMRLQSRAEERVLLLDVDKNIRISQHTTKAETETEQAL